MTIEALLARLERVKRTGPGKWMACCPAHDDRTPSLSIRETEDGRALIHDFGGCDVETVLTAVGLGLSDLFPAEQRIEHARSERRPWVPSDVFAIARQEIAVAAIIACDMFRGRTITRIDFDRLLVAVQRLDDIAGAAYGQ